MAFRRYSSSPGSEERLLVPLRACVVIPANLVCRQGRPQRQSSELPSRCHQVAAYSEDTPIRMRTAAANMITMTSHSREPLWFGNSVSFVAPPAHARQQQAKR